MSQSSLVLQLKKELKELENLENRSLEAKTSHLKESLQSLQVKFEAKQRQIDLEVKSYRDKYLKQAETDVDKATADLKSIKSSIKNAEESLLDKRNAYEVLERHLLEISHKKEQLI